MSCGVFGEGGDWKEGDGTGVSSVSVISEGTVWADASIDNLLFGIEGVGELDPTLDGHAFEQYQNETTMTMGEVPKYQKDDDRSRLPGELDFESQRDLDGIWGLGRGLGTELELDIAGPVSLQGEGSQLNHADNFFENVNHSFSPGHPVWLDLPSSFYFESDIANVDLDMTITVPDLPVSSSSNHSLSGGTSPSNSESLCDSFLVGMQSKTPYSVYGLQLDSAAENLQEVSSSIGTQADHSPASQGTTPPTVRRFSCGMNGCTRSYKRPYELQRHQQSHSRVKRYSCRFSDCGRSGPNGFARKDHLRQHLRQVHGVSS